MELYRYQRDAIDKFVANHRQWPHVLIGDDMGTGKTVIAIALDKARRTTPLSEVQGQWIGNNRRMTLVVTLKSMISAWEDHFKTWAPSATVMSISSTARASLVDAALKQQADVFIVNWDILRMEPKLSHIRWLHKIGDEIQKIKNRKSQVAVAYKAIRALHKTDMSGTWADNQPDDAWSILNHLYPNIWRSYHSFVNYHVIQQRHTAGGDCQAILDPKLGITCGKFHRNSYKTTVGVHDEAKIHREMAPFYIRRTKDQVLSDLPQKTWSTIKVKLHPQQRRAYDSMRMDMLAWVGRHENEPLPAPVVITKLLRLQQLAVAYGRTEWYKKRVVDKDTGEVRFEDAVRLLLSDPSAKLDALMELLEQMPSTDQLVVFGQSKQAIKLFEQRLIKAKESYGLLTGDTTTAARGQLVADFQAKKFRVFAGTIKAGGEGITLTSANKMVFLDRDWSPSKNKQAEDRIHRLGQERPCTYYDLVGEDTIDMGRLQQISNKWEWLKKILGDK